jgi:hypothetical protein
MYDIQKAEWSSNHYTAGNSGAYYKFYIIVIWTDSKKVEWLSNHYTAGNSGAYYRFYIIIICIDPKMAECRLTTSTPKEILEPITGIA